MRTMVPTARLHQDAFQFRLILAATYPFFLAAAALGRFRPARDSSRSGMVTAPRSVFGEARAMAVQAIPFAFMG
ncbi:hypothetical protein [Methylobacterium sp. NEAU K]|uniref:hypothetical protein n=1 Tax=Methylobacterium sp. NEAU K TaxID=3064946 RepID=UPI0027324944|nr:hypothetical protein [Methylobacterium sp. NEAU K]MDP4002936.1 hypothetical protein [Methylobacterium sp. NEAU K]